MKLCFTIVIIMLATGAMAQETTRPMFAPANFKITTRLSQLLFKNLNLTAEQAINHRQTIGLTLEYRPRGKKMGLADAMFGPMGTAYYLPHFNMLYNGATIGVNSKFYFIKGKSLYIDALGFYRRWWFDNKYVDYRNVETGFDIEATRSEQIDVYGFKALFGRSFVKRKSNMAYVLDIFAGIGVRNKQRTSETYNGTINETFYSYKTERGAGWIPTIHGGFQLGIGR